MSAETMARWQFGITTVYHFFFVPVTLALGFLVAILQTMWVRTGQEKFLKLTHFYGRLFLINFAMGVVTGIVQEFQFGMNWSDYSRFVGDIFGAPLALEALLAFFLESTFLGAWIFGWDRLPKKIHLATIWLAAIGTNLSAIFILAANSWMQNPIGWRYNEVANRAELTDFFAVLTNPVFLVTFPHQIAAAWMTSGAFVACIAGWHLHRIGKQQKLTAVDASSTGAEVSTEVAEEISGYRWAAKLGAYALLISSVAMLISGDIQGKIMTDVQPMKMAAAEALYETEQPAAFSILTIGSLDGSRPLFEIKIPHVLSFLATGNANAEVRGINPLNEEYQAQFRPELEKVYGPEIANRMTRYNPNIPVTYWSFRLMMGLGFLAMAIGAWMLFALRKGHLPRGRLWPLLMLVLPFGPLFANSFGWIFTEMGRQPWLVFGVMPTAAGVSPGVSTGTVIFSTALYTVLYGALAVVEVGLMVKYVKEGLPEVSEPKVVTSDDEPLSFAY